jgi:PAS domain-containing protein
MQGLEVILLALFHAFSMKCLEIQRAIRMGDDALVGLLDRELEPIVAAILAYNAKSSLEIYMQLQFMNNLIRREADDRSRVIRNTSAFSVLLHRYFSGSKDAAAEALFLSSGEKPDSDASVFNNGDVLSDIILDSLPDRIAVVTRDYRYLYSNAANDAWLKVKPLELLGRHLTDVIGEEWFEQSVKHKLDACFSGENIDYVCRSYFTGEADRVIRCRMTPLRAEKGEIIGALLVLRDVDVTADVEMA